MSIPKYLQPRKTSQDFTESPHSTYVVHHKDLYYFYSVKAIDAGGIFRLERRPPTLHCGVLVFKKKRYKVSTLDLLRGTVQKTSIIPDTPKTRKKRDQRSDTATTTGNVTDTPGVTAVPGEFEIDNWVESLLPAAVLAFQNEGVPLHPDCSDEEGVWVELTAQNTPTV